MSESEDHPSDPPGSVSSQNQEEGEGDLAHGTADEGTPSKDESKERGAAHDDDHPGGSGEGSQSTGHPDNAG